MEEIIYYSCTVHTASTGVSNGLFLLDDMPWECINFSHDVLTKKNMVLYGKYTAK